MDKRTVLIAGLVVVLAAAVVVLYLYIRYWQEPSARYVETDNKKLIQIREDLKVLKSDLRKRGLYSCCIKNDCNWCAIYMGHCPCARLVARKGNEKSCPECTAAWNRKQGKIYGVDPDAIHITTFGIYGFEEEGHHHPNVTEGAAEELHQHHHKYR